MSHVVIVGAGITGPTAALSLSRAGHAVTVYEQRPADGLHSNGILGLTRATWARLQHAGVHMASGELNGPATIYRDVTLAESARSPFRLITWTDLHDAITRAAHDAGAAFKFQTRANPDTVRADYVIDAGGIVSAARRGLPAEYIGSVIYRGVSDLSTPEQFTTFKLAGKAGFLDLGQTHAGAAWAFGVRRPKPEHYRTTFTDIPPCEAAGLPAEFRRVVMATRHMMILPQQSWSVAPAMHDAAWHRFAIGDANGPVRPITTSGANLGIQAGMVATRLLAGSEETARSLLARRAYALALGLRLTGPEIGGWLEDSEFDANQAAMFGAGGAR